MAEIGRCGICAGLLPHAPRPILSVHARSRILIIGQAPGNRVHATGIPWSDQSGKELRRWLEVDEGRFYDPKSFALVPMGFCFPGTGSGGDLPPRPECALRWHAPLLEKMAGARLVLLVGIYAQRYYLGGKRGTSVTETVRGFRSFLPRFFPLVHPSPRNKVWHKRNPWFETDVLPELRSRVRSALEG